jgi:uncharacterized protein (DUF1778 family)
VASRRVDIKVRVTPQQRAELTAAARALGLTMTDYMAFKALGDAREQALMQQIDARMNATDTALANVMAAHRQATISALEALRVEVIAQGARAKGNLEKLAAAILSRRQE